MSEWKKVKLGDVVSIKSGLSYKSEFLGKGDNLLLGMGCVSFKDSFVESGVRPYSQDCDPRYLAAPGDLVLATRQQSDNLPILAMPAIIPEKYRGKKIIIGTNLYKVENNSDIDNRFLFFVLKGREYVNYIRGVKTGTTVQMVSKRNVEEFQFLCPPRQTREKIVAILSRYDTLIENYQKQIKLLEEAAQRLYKEWFVELRFPGHENTKMVDGLPEGWERKKVGEIGKVITGKTPSTANKENYGGRIPFITIPDMHTGIYPTSSQYLSDLGANSQSGKFIPVNSLMVSCIGTTGLVCITKEKCQTNQQINSLVLNDISLLYYMYNTFLSLKEHLNNIGSNGATMTNVNKSKFENIEVLIPTNSISCLYNAAVKQSFRSIKSLSSQIRLLAEARDRLLPRLMGGEMEV